MATPTSIAVLTAGGDAPGMNAAVRAVVRTALGLGLRAFGVRRGYEGLARGDIAELGARDVGGIIQRGGTVLQTARFPDFARPEVQQEALRQLRERSVDALVAIGGDGTHARRRGAAPPRPPGRRHSGLDRQRRLRHRHGDRRRHRAQHHRRGDRQIARHGGLAPARVHRRDHGPGLRPPRAHVGRHQRRRDDADTGAGNRAPRKSPLRSRRPTRAARRTRSWWWPKARASPRTR